MMYHEEEMKPYNLTSVFKNNLNEHIVCPYCNKEQQDTCVLDTEICFTDIFFSDSNCARVPCEFCEKDFLVKIYPIDVRFLTYKTFK